MQDSIITNLNINVLDSPDVPSTGIFIGSNGSGESVLPVVAISIIIFVVALFIVLMVVRKIRTPKLHSPFIKNLTKTVKYFVFVFALISIAVIGMVPRPTEAADSLITISLDEQPQTVDAERGTELSEAAKLTLSIETASQNDLELDVSFENKTNGITLSTPLNSVTLPAGTISTSVPISVNVSNDIAVGNYLEELEVIVKIKEGFWRTSGRDIVNRWGMVTRLNAINIGSAGSPFWDETYPNLSNVLVQHNDFVYAELENLGINAVRFDFPARLIADYCTTQACLEYDYSEEVFALFDQLLETASSHNVGVMFNIHNSYGNSHPRDGSGPANSKWDTFLPENLEKTTRLWEKIASEFVDDKRVLGFDIMNEPMIRLENGETATDAIKKWDVAAQDMIDAIRAIDKNHMIIVEKANRGLSNNGNSQVAIGENLNYIFPDVTDQLGNIMMQFHDYGNWAYVTQDDDRINNDPWVWPNYDYMGVIKDFASINYQSEAYPRARILGTDQQGAWQTVTSTNGIPATVPAGDPAYNLGNVTISVSGAINNDTEIFVDDVKVEEYEADGTFIKTVYSQTYRTDEALGDFANAEVVYGSADCYDQDGGCLKISGPTTGSTAYSTSWLDLRFFKIDPTKKYMITSHIYAVNLPTTTNVSMIFAYSHGTDEQVRPFDKTYLAQKIQKYVEYSEDNNVPIFNGEYGVLRNGEIWDKFGAEQFVQDSMDVHRENNVHAAYFTYYDRNTNSRERRHGLRVREYATSAGEPVTADNSVLNTPLNNLFLRNKN